MICKAFLLKNEKKIVVQSYDRLLLGIQMAQALVFYNMLLIKFRWHLLLLENEDNICDKMI